MKDFFEHFSGMDFALGVVLTKLLDNNLPNLNWRNILRFIKRVLAFKAYAFAVLWLLILLYTSTQKNPQKAQQLALTGVFMLAGVSLIYMLYVRKLDAAKRA